MTHAVRATVADAGVMEAGKAQPEARFAHAAREVPAEPVVPAGHVWTVAATPATTVNVPVKADALAMSIALLAPTGVMPLPEMTVPAVPVTNTPARPGQ